LDVFFICFSVVDSPVPDPLFDITLDLRRHCYGSNLATAVLCVQQDSVINRRNEDRFQISGLGFDGRLPNGIAAQKAARMKIMADLIAGWYPVNSRPCVVDILISRSFAAIGANSLPPMTFIFADSRVASQIRFKFINQIRTTPSPAIRKGWLEPVLTKATHVQVEILLAIQQALSSPIVCCTVQGRGHSPLLHVMSGGRERVYGFVESCEFFGHLLTADTLQFAYRPVARMFHNRLAATFLVLIDGDQPVVIFFVPAPRPVLAAPVTVSAVSTGAVVPPPVVPNYLQRTLFAPVPSGSGSGRKRPAEASASNPKRSAI
jgi:hypothetical protein